MSRLPRDYRAYGLWVRSPIALPFSLCRPPSTGEPDVTVRIGVAPGSLSLPTADDRHDRWEATPGAFLATRAGVARCLATGGCDVVVEPLGGSDLEMSVFLTSRILVALLQQRGVILFHASAIEAGRGAVLFAGRSGSGKSSLLAALVERGYAMLADNMTGVVLDAAGHPVALSAFPCGQLRTDALDELGWWDRVRGKIRRDPDRRLVRVERFRAAPLAVEAVCLLAPHDRHGIEVRAVPAADAFEALCRYTFRRQYLDGLGRRPAHFRAATALAGRVPVVRVGRPVRPFRLDALADRIEASLQAGLPGR